MFDGIQELWDDQYNCLYYYDPGTGKSSYTKEDLVSQQTQSIQLVQSPSQDIYDSDSGSDSDIDSGGTDNKSIHLSQPLQNNPTIKELWDETHNCAYYYDPSSGRTSYVYDDLLKTQQAPNTTGSTARQTSPTAQGPNSPAADKEAYWDLDSSDGVEELWVSNI